MRSDGTLPGAGSRMPSERGRGSWTDARRFMDPGGHILRAEGVNEMRMFMSHGTIGVCARQQAAHPMPGAVTSIYPHYGQIPGPLEVV